MLKTIIIITIIVITIIIVVRCTNIFGIIGSNTIVDVNITETPKDFTKVELGFSITGNITQAPDYNLEIKANENLVTYLTYEKVGDILKIYLDPEKSFMNVKVTANIQMPNITLLHANNSAIGKLTDFEQESIEIKSSTSAKIEGSNIIADILKISGESSSNIKLTSSVINEILDVSSTTMGLVEIKGTGHPNLRLNGRKSSNIKLSEITVGDADVILEKSAPGELTMDGGKLDANLSSSSKLIVHGTYLEGNINIETSANLVAD